MNVFEIQEDLVTADDNQDAPITLEMDLDDDDDQHPSAVPLRPTKPRVVKNYLPDEV